MPNFVKKYYLEIRIPNHQQLTNWAVKYLVYRGFEMGTIFKF